jgi:hypothetical protein
MEKVPTFSVFVLEKAADISRTRKIGNWNSTHQKDMYRSQENSKIENPKEKQKINEKQIATCYIIRICKLHRQANKTTATWGSRVLTVRLMAVYSNRPLSMQLFDSQLDFHWC